MGNPDRCQRDAAAQRCVPRTCGGRLADRRGGGGHPAGHAGAGWHRGHAHRARCDPCCADAGPCRLAFRLARRNGQRGARSWRRFHRLGRWRICHSPVVATLTVALATLWPTIAALMAARAPDILEPRLGRSCCGSGSLGYDGRHLRHRRWFRSRRRFSGYCLCNRCFAVRRRGFRGRRHCRLGLNRPPIEAEAQRLQNAAQLVRRAAEQRHHLGHDGEAAVTGRAFWRRRTVAAAPRRAAAG